MQRRRGIHFAIPMAALAFFLLTPSAQAGEEAMPPMGRSVDPAVWAKSPLLEEREGQYFYDHYSACGMRDAGAQPEERALVRIQGSAAIEAMSRDQLVALIQRMEAVFLMGIGEGWRPGASAMTMAQILDCRPRKRPGRAPDLELAIQVSAGGFEATFSDHRSNSVSKHSETWQEAFRP